MFFAVVVNESAQEGLSSERVIGFENPVDWPRTYQPGGSYRQERSSTPYSGGHWAEIERQTGQSVFGHSQIPLTGTISERDGKGSRREDYVKTNRVEISAPVPSRDRG